MTDRPAHSAGVDSLLALADRVVAMARPGEQVEAFASRDRETDIRVYCGEVEHFVSAQSEGIGIRVIHEGRTGFAYAGQLDESAVRDVLDQARENSRYGTPDEWAGLAVPDGHEVTHQHLWDESLADAPTERKIELAMELERLALAGDGRVRVDDANYADVFAEMAVATTTGIRVGGRENGCFLSAMTLADEAGETQTGFGFSVGRNLDELDVADAASSAVRRATRLLGATKPKSGRTTVVLDPYVTAQFVGVLSSTLNGENVAKGRSIFADRVGERVASDVFTLVDDPTNPLAYTATELDGEGLAARRNELIRDGVLQQFVHSSYSARRVGALSTGNAVRGGFKGTPGVGCLALQLQPGTRTQESLVADLDDAVLVQVVQGLHSGVNPISGDFSVGAAGLTIRGGATTAPIREFTIASTLQRMLTNVAEVGCDLEWLPMRSSGVSLVMHDVTISGA